MNTTEIKDILDSLLPKCRVNFLGVFARDLLPDFSNDISTFPKCCICNTDTSNESGKHWVAFYSESSSHLEFFDSYGLHPSFYSFDVPLTSYNNKQFQKDSSRLCGHYCIYYIYKRSSGNSLVQIQRKFNLSNMSLNDSFISKWSKKHFKSVKPLSHLSCSNQCCKSFIDCHYTHCNCLI